MFICILLRLNLDFCFQSRNIYTCLCLLHLKRCGWSPGSIRITVMIEKPTDCASCIYAVPFRNHYNVHQFLILS